MERIEYPPYIATRLYEDFYSIDQDDMVRCFLVVGTEKALLVDSCATAEGDLVGLVRQLTQLPVVLVHTHSDFDHIAASIQFPQLYMHPSEFSRLRKTEETPLDMRAIREGEVVDLGNRRFQVLLIPGHTSGSIALLDEEHRLLIGGDSISLGIHYMFGPGRDLPAYIDSIERLCGQRARFDRVLPSHGPLPVESDFLPELLEAAKKLAAGQLTGVDDGCGMPCLLYRHRRAQFYY